MIIAICGKRHSGKSTTENMLMRILKEESKACASFALAAPIKNIAASIEYYNTVDERNFSDIHAFEYFKIRNKWDTDIGKKELMTGTNITRREFLIKFGSEFMHPICINAWLNEFKYRYFKNPKAIWIIPDLRMVHEYKYLKTNINSKLLVIKLIGDPAQLSDDIMSNHKSETETDLIEADLEINTDNVSKDIMITILKQFLKRKDLI